MSQSIGILGWLLVVVAVPFAVFGWTSWHITQKELRRCEGALHASERECERLREVGLRTVEMWQAADKARAEGRSVNEALSPFLARPVSSRESEESRR